MATYHPPPSQPVANYYVTRGERYYVIADNTHFEQIGTASWYGEQFHGKVASDGSIYNMHANTAAHKTLPLGSKVKVTNLANGKSAMVTITDRGPFIGNRIIDLSVATAKKIGLYQPGTGKVRVEVLPPYRQDPVLYFPTGRYIQLGAFKSIRPAERVAAKAKRAIGEVWVSIRQDKKQRYLVWVGPFYTIQMLYEIDKKLDKANLEGYVIVNPFDIIDPNQQPIV